MTPLVNGSVAGAFWGLAGLCGAIVRLKRTGEARRRQSAQRKRALCALGHIPIAPFGAYWHTYQKGFGRRHPMKSKHTLTLVVLSVIASSLLATTAALLTGPAMANENMPGSAPQQPSSPKQPSSPQQPSRGTPSQTPTFGASFGGGAPIGIDNISDLVNMLVPPNTVYHPPQSPPPRSTYSPYAPPAPPAYSPFAPY
jgi:hypothetical protein